MQLQTSVGTTETVKGKKEGVIYLLFETMRSGQKTIRRWITLSVEVLWPVALSRSQTRVEHERKRVEGNASRHTSSQHLYLFEAHRSYRNLLG